MTSEPAAEPAPDSASAQPAAADIRVTAGDPNVGELAALTAVLTAALDEVAQEHRRRESAPTAWRRSQREGRPQLLPGTWETFGR